MVQTVWIDTLLSDDIASGGRDVVFLGASGLSVVQRRIERFTLLRTIIRVDLASTVRDSGEGDQLVDLAIAIVDGEQTVVADMPDPSAEGDFPAKPWVWRARYRVYASSVNDQNVDVIRIDKDLRGRRKLENGRLVYLGTNQANQGTSTAVTSVGIIRQLYQVG